MILASSSYGPLGVSLPESSTFNLSFRTGSLRNPLQRRLIEHSLGEELLQLGVLLRSNLRNLRASETVMPAYFAFQL